MGQNGSLPENLVKSPRKLLRPMLMQKQRGFWCDYAILKMLHEITRNSFPEDTSKLVSWFPKYLRKILAACQANHPRLSSKILRDQICENQNLIKSKEKHRNLFF